MSHRKTDLGIPPLQESAKVVLRPGDIRQDPSGSAFASSSDVTGLWFGCASYVDRILRGEKPADLPVQAPVKYQTIVNLKTAKLLGLEVPGIAACSRR